MELITIEPVQMTFDYSDYSPQLAASLERHAETMEGFTKRYAADMGKELAAAKAEIHAAKQTGWAKWVEGRLGITVRHADRCIENYEKEKSGHNVSILPSEAPPPIETAVSPPSSLDFYERWATDNQALGLDRFGDPLPIEIPESKETVLNDAVDIPEEEAIASLPKEQRDLHVMRVMGSSESPEWYTPQEIVHLSIKLLGKIDLDPCSNSRDTPNIPALNHYTKEDNGLSQIWQGKVYLNPPYGSEIPQWVEKLVHSYEYGEVTEAIALLPARIDTVWFQPIYEHRYPMCIVRGRIQYENSPYHAPFPCVIVYLGLRITSFIEVFKAKGPIMGRIG